MKGTSVSKCLDNKLIMFGFEVMDILAIFLCLSVLNLVFSNTGMKFFLVWIPTVLLALALRYGKRGKPDKYLVHWIRYQIQPGLLSAFAEPTISKPPPRLLKLVVS